MSPFTVSSSSLHCRKASYLGPLAEGLLCSLLVLAFAHPCCQGRGLQGSPIWKGQFPRLRQRGLIHGIQVDRSLLFTLTSRQEADSCKKKVSRLRNEVLQPPQSLTFMCQRSEHVRCRSKASKSDSVNGYIGMNWESPGTAAGTVRRRVVTVAMATSWGVYFLGQECPAVTMLGFSSVPSR